MLDLLLDHIGNVQKMDCRECSILNLVMKALQSINELEILLVTMATLPPAKELKIQVVSWQNEIRTLDVLKSPTCSNNFDFIVILLLAGGLKTTAE